MSIDAFQACARFGLGPRPGEIATVAGDPRGWLLSQLQRPSIPKEVAGFAGRSEATEAFLARLEARKTKENVEAAALGIRQAYIKETGTRLVAQVRSDQPFIERLVLFWSNHFTVSVQKPVIAALVNRFEVEAIRPYVTGRFADMLKAVASHPAMLLYLDNAQSFGPNSLAGQRRNRGLNENLAREILELHTLGVDGGYTQTDVIAFAKILTGWTLQARDRATFAFQPRAHEPGAHQLLGRSYGAGDMNDGLRALDDLARHPATARHIAVKLARHFIADDPPPDAVAQLAEVFRQSDGNLATVSRTLVEMKASWQEPLTKVKTPYEFAVSALRLTAIEPTPEQAIVGLAGLNFRPFGALSPAGFADTASGWISADAVLKRIEWSRALALRLPPQVDPKDLAAQSIGPVMREDTRFVIAGAASGRDGMALLLASPEFQRR